MRMTTSMPFTHCTAAVERATVSVKSKTRTTDQKRPPPNELRALSQRSSRRFSVLSNAASGPASRPSGDTYRIPGPHEAREVVALAYDVKVDGLALVEAGVLVRAAEAGDVEVKHDERRAAASHRLQQANPFRVRARRDDRDGASGEPADAVPRQRLGEWRAAVGLAHREEVEDEAVLPDRAVRLEHGAARIVRDQSNLASPAVHLRRHRRRQADRVFDRRLFPVTEMDAAVEVKKDPQVGGQGLLERLRHQPLVLGRERPVDSPEAVARRVVAHAACLRRVVSPGAERLRASHLLRARSHQVGHRPDTWVHEDRRALGELQLAVEQAEWFTHAQRCRTERYPAASPIHAPRPPPHSLAAEGDDTARLVVGDLAEVADLDPRRGNPALAPNLELLLIHLTDGRSAGVDA